MMPDLPGWDSLPAVTRYHNWAEALGIAFLALLVVAEVISYQYGHRRDSLTEQQQITTNQRHEEEMARLRLETAKLQERAAHAELKTEQIRQRRTLDPEKFRKTLANVPGLMVEISYLENTSDGQFLAADLQNMLTGLNRGWRITKFEEIPHLPKNLNIPLGQDISSGIIMEYDASFGPTLENPSIHGLCPSQYSSNIHRTQNVNAPLPAALDRQKTITIRASSRRTKSGFAVAYVCYERSLDVDLAANLMTKDEARRSAG
jgi:hypothetical protein